jgi:hypothetical protein
MGFIKKSSGGDGGVDITAIHKTTAGEISAISNKTTPISTDYILIEDSADGNKKKSITISELPTDLDTTAIHKGTASEISAITSKANPIGADYIVIEDSADTNKKKSATLLTLPIPTLVQNALNLKLNSILANNTGLPGYLLDGVTLIDIIKINISNRIQFGADVEFSGLVYNGLSERKRFELMPKSNYSASTKDQISMEIAAVGTESVISADSTKNSAINWLSGSGAEPNAGWGLQGNEKHFSLTKGFDIQFIIQAPDTMATFRIINAISTGDRDGTVYSDNANAGHLIGIGLSSALTETYWMIVTSNGTNRTRTSTTVLFNPAKIYKIRLSAPANATTVTWGITNITDSLAEVTGTVAATLPALTDMMQPVCILQSTTSNYLCYYFEALI